MIKHGFIIFLLLGCCVLSAQTITGKVFDKVSLLPLSGASITVLGTSNGASSDTNGNYEIVGLKPGRLSIEASFVGYQSVIINDLWVKSGVTTIQDIELFLAATSLDEIVVVPESTLSKSGNVRITEEAINRYAAAYNDPARLITHSPDITVVNDQNNLVSVRGVSPDYNVWRLEGVEIVNPNHLSNAGTFLDQPAGSGGGVNILSAQMLAASDFKYGSFSADYGNSVGGIFDMKLKSGNEQKRNHTAQASFIGFDVASEGPIKEGRRATYAINYRYSFTGLLANMGVDFGGEAIGFQDLSFNVTSPIDAKSSIKIFGVGGISFNEFEHKSFEESEIQKDRNDINYENRTGLIGLKYNRRVNKGSINSTLILSGFENSRNQIRYDEFDQRSFADEFLNQNNTILGTQFQYNRSIRRGAIQTGMNMNLYRFESFQTNSIETVEDQFLISPYLSYTKYLNHQWDIVPSINYLQSNQKGVFDPRLSLNYYMNRKSTLSGSIGFYSQLLNPDNYLYDNPYQRTPDRNLGVTEFIRSLRGSLQYSFEKQQLRFNTDAYFYHFLDVYDKFQNQSTANIFGIAMSAERSFFDGYYYNVGMNLFRSLIDQQRSHFDMKHSLNLSGGKEWSRTKSSGLIKSFSVNLRSHWQGGRYFSEITYRDDDVLLTSPEYSQEDFYRLDLRLVWTRSKVNRTSSLSLDVQNITNTQNESFRYFDSFTRMIESQNNLGLIPILTYRLEW